MSAILLATYNGAAWLPEFLASVRRQTRGDWRMLIRDDDSTDATPEILAEAAACDPRFVVLSDNQQRLGLVRNFGRLMEQAPRLDERHFFFADQDDVWLPDKLERQLAAMRALEDGLGNDVPILVHTDLRVVDGELREIHASHTIYAGVRRTCGEHRALPTILMHNCATGCASLINRPLLEIALPLPPAAVLHDWWIAACAAAFGKIHYLPEPLVLYRQHAGNAVGAASLWHRLKPWQIVRNGAWQHIQTNVQKGFGQARALRDRLRERGAGTLATNVGLVEDYCHAFDANRSAWRRRTQALRMRRLTLLDRVLLAICATSRT
jgi:rhamnosyltransferase